MIISHSRRFIFIHVNKAGGSSMELALAEHLAWNDLILGTTEIGQAAKGPFERAHGLSEHSTLQEIVTICGSDLVASYFKFALVRHPVARLVSLYNFVHSRIERDRQGTGLGHDTVRRMIRAREEDPDMPFLSWPASRAYAESNDFGGFIRSPDAHSDRGFMPQTDRLHTPDGRHMVDMVLRLEDVALDLPTLESRLGVRIALGHVHRTPLVVLRSSEVRVEDRRYIRERFAADYLAFEYR